jgi:transposase
MAEPGQVVTEDRPMAMQRCPVCGEGIDDLSVDFCPSCGEAIDAGDVNS